MRKAPSKLLVLLIVLVFSASFFTPEIFASNSEDATASIEKAENALVSAYQAILEAEEGGADVSGLLAQLNEAGEFLADAHMMYRLVDFDEATRFADLCYDVGESVKNKADELRVDAYESRTMGLWLTISGSLVGMGAVVFGSFLGWRVFKRRYYERVLRKKPEVAKDES